jgi:hypothetical protein
LDAQEQNSSDDFSDQAQLVVVAYNTAVVQHNVRLCRRVVCRASPSPTARIFAGRWLPQMLQFRAAVNTLEHAFKVIDAAGNSQLPRLGPHTRPVA